MVKLKQFYRKVKKSLSIKESNLSNKLVQKLLSLGVSASLMAAMAPLGWQNHTAYASAPVIPQEMFITRDDLVKLCRNTNNGQGLLATGNEKNDKELRINFGTRPSEVKYYANDAPHTIYAKNETIAANTPMTWLVAGSEDTGVVLYSEEPMMSCKGLDRSSNSLFQENSPHGHIRGDIHLYMTTDGINIGFLDKWGTYDIKPYRVYINHYGASNLRQQAQMLVNTYFTNEEQSLISETTVTSKDIKNNVDYTTTDKLYAASFNGKYNYSRNTSITVGATDMLIIDKEYWKGLFWLRSPDPDASVIAFYVYPGKFVFQGAVLSYDPAVALAFNLNLSSVIFASAASASHDSGFSEIEEDTPMQLRLPGFKALESVSLSAGYNKLTYSAPAGSRLIILASTFDGETDQYSKDIIQDANDETLNFYRLAKGSGLDGEIVSAKAWVEMDDPTSDQSQIKYASSPIDFNLDFASEIVTLETIVKINGHDQKILVRGDDTVVPYGAELVATAVPYSEGLDTKNMIIDKQFHYDIKLLDDKGAPLPMPLSEPVELCFQVIDSLDKNDLEVILRQIGDDIQFEEDLVCIDGNDYVCVKTVHFSPYSLIDKLSNEEKAANNRAILFTVVGTILLLILAVGIFLKVKANKRKLNE